MSSLVRIRVFIAKGDVWRFVIGDAVEASLIEELIGECGEEESSYDCQRRQETAKAVAIEVPLDCLASAGYYCRVKNPDVLEQKSATGAE